SRRKWPILDAVEIAAAGNEQAFDADAVRVFKQARIVAGRPWAFLARANDLGAEIPHRSVQSIDIFARAQAETKVVQTDAPLIECRVAMRGRSGADQHARAAANAVEHFRRVILDIHAERFVQQAVIEATTGGYVAHSQLDMGDA